MLLDVSADAGAPVAISETSDANKATDMAVVLVLGTRPHNLSINRIANCGVHSAGLKGSNRGVFPWRRGAPATVGLVGDVPTV
ncbi:hypothetical protein GCM10012275_34950 [Longimycelium tulufanense]|uniref:Uncharacterized protein n=1 Tax=Longimycelium tulufanense TaxID=907463 RepID=A0A8J3CCY1_9PSEU|nr:hypothetical protein GCM10012275_34950 [Longimycelium tulufanense]